jgi:hypothetical protein
MKSNSNLLNKCKIVNIMTLVLVTLIIFIQIVLFFYQPNCSFFGCAREKKETKTIKIIKLTLLWIQRSLVILLFILLLIAIYCSLRCNHYSILHPKYHGEQDLSEFADSEIIQSQDVAAVVA